MKNLASLILVGALSSMLLTGCATEPEPVAEPTTSTPAETSTEATTPETTPEAKPEEKPVEDNTPLAEKPADGDEVAVLETGKGKIIVMFYPQVAPKHVENFKMLVKKGFYDGTRFHRCIPGFMVQGGDPNSKNLDQSATWGTGGHIVDGAEVNVPAEFGSRLLHKRGVLSMARSGDPNSASSQFFLMHQDSAQLDGEYSAFGKIVSGQEVVDAIVQTGDPAANGAVEPKAAILLKKATLAKWPVK
jgi:peptidyl-prolyl cis-trans isomerase B (cyclophilin B)